MRINSVFCPYFVPLKQIELEFEGTVRTALSQKWRENQENLVPNVKTADSYLFRIEYRQIKTQGTYDILFPDSDGIPYV